MPDLQGFQESRSGLGVRDLSPDSVIFTAESNFSLFSSASGSVERCSFTSDVVPDQDARVSQHLSGHELSEVLSGGPDPQSNDGKSVYRNSVSFTRKEKAKAHIIDSSEAETTEDETIAFDSARNSFSQALKECQDRRLRSEILLKKTQRRRPASVDFNNSLTDGGISSSSPRIGIMKKQSTSARKIGTFPSPGTPNFRHTSVGVQKGWSSERIPLHSNPNRRSVNNALFPYNGKALPSKWEDAERWIFSPVSGDGMVRNSNQQPQRRPKSKSGPLGPPGVAYYQMFSPGVAVCEGGNNGKLVANSPLLTGIMGSDALSLRYEGRECGGNFIAGVEHCMARSISIHGCSEVLSQTTVQGHLDVKYDATNGDDDAPNNISRVISRRDMATQMSPESSARSSPTVLSLSSFSLATPNVLPTVEIQSSGSSRLETRDVSVDEKVTMTRWSKKNRSKNTGKSSHNDDWKRKAMSIRSNSWEMSTHSSRSLTKVQREEAKITAWENLQKAKAEAAIRKLEVKLEKKRSSSMDKILNKLKAAQKKAQEMRNAANQTSHQIPRSSDKRLSFRRRTTQIGSLSGCFTCPAF